jgi:hypothetical protein
MTEPSIGSFETLFVELHARDGVAEVFLSDFPVARAGSLPGGPRLGIYLPLSDARPIQQHLAAVDSTLRLVMSAAPGDDGAPLSDGARARARVVRFREGDVIDSDESGAVIAELAFPPPLQAGETLPRELRATFAAPVARGRPIWEDAGPASLDEPFLDRVEAIVNAVADALRAGDEASFAALLEPYARDQARAYPERPLARIDAAHRAYARAFRGGGRVSVSPRSEWRPRLVASGRLVEPRVADGTSALVAHPPGGEPVDLPLFVGWVGDTPLVFR